MADNNDDQSTDLRNLQAEGIRVTPGDGSRLQDILSSQSTYTNGLYSAYPILAGLIAMQSGEESQPSINPGGGAFMRLSGITFQDLARLMSVGTATRVGNRVHIEPDEDGDEDDEDHNGPEDVVDDDYIRASAHQWYPPVKEPQKAGLELLANGDFGRVGVKARSRRNSYNILKTVSHKFYRPLPLTSREDLHTVR